MLFLDFDGTLSPIVKNPKDAILSPDIKLWLQKLSKKRTIKIGIVTGRSLPDIKQKVGLKNIIYAANHGMEIFYKGRYLLNKGGRLKKPLKSFGDKIQKILTDVHGVFIESKGLSVAVHYRNVAKIHKRAVRDAVYRTASPYVKRYKLQVTKGKELFELRPALQWNKGKAVMWLWKKRAPKYFPIYVGDDITDEDAFKAIRPFGLAIRIGRKKDSCAEYYVKSIRAILKWRYLHA